MNKKTNLDFEQRHIGPSPQESQEILQFLNSSSLEDFTQKVVPANLLSQQKFEDFKPLNEQDFLSLAEEIGQKNKVYRSYIGQGYYNTLTPSVIQRNIFESPAWYTAYTPYQAEISQGRLEAILNFQTMVMDLTGMEIANASLLDEATAAAEAMSMCKSLSKNKKAHRIVVDENVFKQTIDVLKTRAWPLDIEVQVCDIKSWSPSEEDFAFVFQYPNSLGEVENPKSVLQKAKDAKVLSICCTDLMALTQLEAPGHLGFDVAVGSTQRFGVPMGFGGPHAAFFATREDFKRSVPGRIIGVSKDRRGKMALRMALQTREQHIRRERATSNICTSQVLLAVMSSMYAVYHGPEGLKEISLRIHQLAQKLKLGLEQIGFKVSNACFFDTLSILEGPQSAEDVIQVFKKNQINVGRWKHGWQISVDETWSEKTCQEVLSILGFKDFAKINNDPSFESNLEKLTEVTLGDFKRTTSFLEHEVFNSYHSETEMLRYIYRLQGKDLTLTHTMIPLGSCTMKLNATSEMQPISQAHWAHLHPFIPADQHEGYTEMIERFEKHMKNLTGFSAISFQPNAGSQGEYAGLLVIRKYFESQGESRRNICLIPSSAHGTNPASAVMAGFKVVVVQCDENGNINLDDLKDKCLKHKDQLAAMMLTYPSTHGVFERDVKLACTMVHESGGQVYLDGANFNALMGMIRPADLGADVAHFNLHKTFCIPHGGGGPGVGPIGLASHLVPFMPKHNQTNQMPKHNQTNQMPKHNQTNQPGQAENSSIGPVCAAPWGSASILPISWAYIEMMGLQGLTRASQYAILNANYIATRLKDYYPILYTGPNGFVAHECIIDVRPFKKSANVTVDDIAKRLMDFGFHSPTMSWPVAGTLMIEPTESESKTELDRFCDAMIQIYQEMKKIESGEFDKNDNPLTMAPHTIEELSSDDWSHPYTRQEAAYPLGENKMKKFWTSVSRVDNASGDRNLVCSCPPLSEYE